MSRIAAFLLATLLSAAALAGLDHDTDQIGVYFDPYGNSNCGELPVLEATYAYVVLMNPSDGVRGFEFSYTITAPPSLIRLGNVVPGCTSFGCVDTSPNLASGFYKCGISTPLSPAMVLVRWDFLAFVPASATFRLGPAPNPALTGGLPVLYGGAHGFRLAGVSSGDPALPVATWGGPGCPVADEASSFGRVKALFR